MIDHTTKLRQELSDVQARLIEVAAERDRLQNEVDDLRAFIDGIKKPILKAAAMYGARVQPSARDAL